MLTQVGQRVERDPELKTLPNTAPKTATQIALAPDIDTPTTPPQLPEATELEVKEWFLPNSEDPIALSQLEAIANADTLVWHNSLPDWTPAAQVPALAGLFEDF